MRVFIPYILLLSISLVWADGNQSTCEKFCVENYEKPEELDSCRKGCEYRTAVMDHPGPFKFLDCQRHCDEEMGEKSPVKEACGKACSLPWVSSLYLMMTRENDGKGKAEWKVVQAEGDEVREFQTNGDENNWIFDNFLKPKADHLGFKGPLLGSSSDEDGSSEEELVDGAYGSDDWKNILFHKIMKQMKSNMDQLAGPSNNIAAERPSGPYANQKGPQVADMNVWQSHPNENVVYQIKPAHSDWSSWIHRRHMFLVMCFMMAVMTFFMTLTCLCFRRQPYNAAYSRIWSERIPVWGRVQHPGPGPIPVKKIPDEGWPENTEPIGIAPPAYDQVSIHKSPDSDASTAEAQTPSPIHH